MKSIRLKHKVKINFKNPKHDLLPNQCLVHLIKLISLIIYHQYCKQTAYGHMYKRATLTKITKKSR